MGIDVFIEWDAEPAALAESLETLTGSGPLHLKMISNRGTMVFPASRASPAVVDHYRCRFVAKDGHEPSDADILALVARIAAGHRWMHLEKLQTFDAVPGYTRAQGEGA